ncbi:MAG: NAD-binding protein [candidate division Zixibacteria bacterium]
MKRPRGIYILGIIALILMFGTIGFQIVEPDYGFLDAFYMTVITITTIGYGEIKPLSDAGKIFNLLLIALGWTGLFLAAKMAGEIIVHGQMLKLLGRHRMDKKLASLKDHFIVCGYGRVGGVVCDELARYKARFVVIEKNPEMVEELIEKGYIYYQGDCTDDQSLFSAGIDRAHALINAVADEADAVYITLSCRQQNPDLFIVARADSPSAVQKLKRAGADKVISPHVSAGSRMVMGALRPNVVDFMTIAPLEGTEGLRIEEVVVSEGSPLIGKSFKELDVRARYGLNVIGIKKHDGKMIYNPSAEQIIDADDTLIMVGGGEQLSQIDELCAPVSDG